MSKAHSRPSAQQWQAGMTLLELMLVVVILSAAAFMTLSQMTDGASQVRFEDTQNRLKAIEVAIVGHSSPVFNGQRSFSGYAADNGLIPTDVDSIEALTDRDTRGDLIEAKFDPYQSQQPIFDPIPDDDGYNNGGGTTLSAAQEGLVKGWRGSYLPLVSSNGSAYYDGWSGSAPAPGFGWQVAVVTAEEDLTITSLGRDGAAGSAVPPYDDDLFVAIDTNDWMVDTKNWAVTIANNSGADIDITAPACLRLSLLVYRNKDTANTAGRWRRLTSECLVGNTATESAIGLNDGSCLDGDGDNLVDGEVCGSRETVIFTESGYDTVAGTLTTLVPQGRHLLVAVYDEDDANKHTAGGASVLCDSTPPSSCNSSVLSVQKVDLFNRVALPAPVLQIAP